MKFIVTFFIPFIFILFSYAQEKNNDISVTGKIDTLQSNKLTKSPLKAALYSAVLPGLGQTYNKKYWKIPIVWGAIGTGVGFVLYYNNQYTTFRNAYISSLNGETHEFSNIEGYTTEILARAQDDQRRNRDYAIVITSLLYTLNIIDALVDAHLFEIRKDKDLALSPVIITNPASFKSTAGIGIKLNF